MDGGHCDLLRVALTGSTRIGSDSITSALPYPAVPTSTQQRLYSTIRASPMAGSRTSGCAFILEFRDPDNIALELFAPAT